MLPLNETILIVREQWAQRQAWHRAEKALTLQAKALCRRLVRGDKADAARLYSAVTGKGEHALVEAGTAAVFPLLEGRAPITKRRKAIERELVARAKTLPVAGWVAGQRGVGFLILAGVVGEAGDLSAYATHSKLWKRMGLAVMPDGTRQRKVAGDAAIEHGYAPARRSLVWTMGDCIIKAGGPWKEAYDARKVIELERVETKGHAHNRAKRYVEKRVLRSLWNEWRRSMLTVPQGATAGLSFATLSHAEVAFQ